MGRPLAWLTDYDTGGTDGTGRQNLSAVVIKSNSIGPTNYQVIESPQFKSSGFPKCYSVGLPKNQQISFPKRQIRESGNLTYGSNKSTANPSTPKGKPIVPNKTVHRTSPKTETSEPTSVKDALTSPSWTIAMKEELKALDLNNTWRLLPRQDWMNVVGSRWVFRIKQNSDGSLDRYKARLVAKGFHQKHGEDYNLTYSPVVKAATIRTILVIATSRKWKLNHLDICNAFLNGKLTKTVYMEQPPGFTAKSTTARSHACQLQKAIYGLKQAPRAWYQRLKEFLQECGFFNSTTDSSLFIKRNQTRTIYVLIYVDDFVITGDCEAEVRNFINAVCKQFRCRDLGQLSYFLGLEMEVTEILKGSPPQIQHDGLKTGSNSIYTVVTLIIN